MKRVLFIFSMFFGIQAFAQTSGSHWKVVYVWDGLSMVNIKTKKTEVVLSLPEKKLSGNAGCNSFHGTLDYTKGDNIKPIKLVNKKENCPATPDRLDNAVVTSLNLANKLVINQNKAKFYQGDKLVLELDR